MIPVMQNNANQMRCSARKTFDSKVAKTEKNLLKLEMHHHRDADDNPDDMKGQDFEDDIIDEDKKIDIVGGIRNKYFIIDDEEENLKLKESNADGQVTRKKGNLKKVAISNCNDKQELQQQQQQQHHHQHHQQQNLPSSPLRRRPVSLHGQREDIIFNSSLGISGLGGSSSSSWTPITRASSADKPSIFSRPITSSQSSATTLSLPHQSRPLSVTKTEDSSSRTTLPNNLRSFRNSEDVEKRNHVDDAERSSEISTPDSFARSGKSLEFECSSEDESRSGACFHPQRQPSTVHGTWPIKQDLWGSVQPTTAGVAPVQPLALKSIAMQNVPSLTQDLTSLMSFSSGAMSSNVQHQGQKRLGAKMDVVYSLLSMLGSNENKDDMSETLLSMSSSVESCMVMRQSGCLPLLIQLIHTPTQDVVTRERASRALYNIVHAKSDEKTGRREARVLRLLEQLREYCQTLRNTLSNGQPPNDDLERHPGATIAALMKLSFDESHRHAMCQLGGLHAVAELIEMDHKAHGSECDDQNCITLRRYAGMALTNLTFGDGNNKALLCSFKEFMKALVSQLRSPSDDLRQVTASVLRNLSWRADSSSKETLREVGAVVGLMRAAMEGRKESTLKSVLSALWNLSAHCSTNKMDICAVEGALAFLVDMLSYNAPSRTLAIVENAGGILRNVSSHIAVREDYRAVVRERGCLQVLLKQLRSPSLTVVSNACGALWNLSARCPQDQKLLWDLGAVPMLRSLVHSKHKMISMGSSAALKNLLSARPNGSNIVQLDSTARGLGLPTLPSLMARRQKALEQEIDQNLSETCENIEPSTSPINKDDKFPFKLENSFSELANRVSKNYVLSQPESLTSSQPSTSAATGISQKHVAVARSESKESVRSVTSTQSDTIFEKVNRQVCNGMVQSSPSIQLKQQSASLHSAVNFDGNSNSNNTSSPAGKANSAEKKYTLRYMNAIPERLKPAEILKDLNNLKLTTSTISWATTPNQENSFISSALHSSLEDNLRPNSNESSLKYTGARAKSTSPFPIYASVQKNTPVSLPDPFSDYAEAVLEQHTSDDEKQSSAYFTGTDQELAKNFGMEENLSSLSRRDSANSSRTSSASDVHEHDGKSRSQFSKIPEVSRRISGIPKPPGFKTNFGQKLKFEPKIGKCRVDSPRSSINSESTLEAVKSLESDSAVFEDEANLAGSSGVTSISSVGEDQEKLDNSSSTLTGPCSIHYEGDTESMELIEDEAARTRTISPTEDRCGQTNLIRYKTNSSLNDLDTQDDYITAGNSQISSLPDDQHQNIDEDDVSEMTYTMCKSELSQTLTADADYYSVQETYTVNKDNKVNQNLLSPDECSLSQLTSTLSYMSVEDKDFTSVPDKIEKTDDSTLTYKTITSISPSNLEIAKSINESIQKSEQALLELCIKSDNAKPKLSEINKFDKKRVSISKDAGKKMNSSLNEIKENSPVYNERSISASISKIEEEYKRQRDPDAMIASLDRLTAHLVQQTEAIREKDLNSMKGSLLSSDQTWNEDSLHDVSFPTLSVSAPLMSSFRSEEIPAADILENNSIHSSLTDSRIIEREANKLAEAVTAEVNDVTSVASDIDAINAIKPPSTMGSLISLTTSINGGIIDTNVDSLSDKTHLQTNSLPSMNSSSNEHRKKSLPVGVVARRALYLDSSKTGSLENLSCDYGSPNVSRIENVKQPSLMDEILNDGDMENSMLSVASITSEIADIKETSLTSSDPVFDIIKPAANILSMTCMRYAQGLQGSGNSSISDCLDNINPPSLFNEVSQMDDTTIEANTNGNETMCNDAEFNSEDATQFVFDERIEEIANDTDEAITPIPSEYCVTSSAESTPKKKISKCRLTPKQKRQLTKERYKTYTIAAERIKKEEEDRKKEEQYSGNSSPRDTGKCSPFSKLTPKQRRQEDRARFQTQVLEPPAQANKHDNELNKSHEKSGIQSLIKTGIPKLRKFAGSKIAKLSGHKNKNFNSSKDIIEDSSEYSEDQSEKVSGLLDNAKNVPVENVETTIELKGNDIVVSCEPKISIQDDHFTSEEIKFVNGVTKKLSIIHQSQQEGDKIHEDDPKNPIELNHNNDYVDSDAESENEEAVSEKEEIKEIKRPRIVKPGTFSRELSTESNQGDKESEIPKGIRGRRKQLYSSPATRKTTPQSSPLKQIDIPVIRSNTSPMVRATRATTLRQNNSFQKVNAIPKANTPTNANLVKQNSVFQKKNTAIVAPKISNPFKPTPPIKPLERQGTFTKDEPEMENTLEMLPSSPAIKSKSATSSAMASPKISPVHLRPRSFLKTPQRISNSHILTKTLSSEKITTPTGSNIPSFPNAKRSVTNLSGPIMKSSSNTQIVPPKVQRSNSNSSIVTTLSAASTNTVQNRKVIDSKSKIASLWKKVEESKNKQKFEKPDTRQWITPNKVNAEVDSSNSSLNGKQQSSYRLFRSSTFEGVSKDETKNSGIPQPQSKIQKKGGSNIPVNGVKYRNSCDFSGVNVGDSSCKIPLKSKDNETCSNVVMRRQINSTNNGASASDLDPTKRISRLGSFITVDSNESQQIVSNSNIPTFRGPNSAIVQPFNYIPRQDNSSVKNNIDIEDRVLKVKNYHSGIATACSKVTTV